LEESLIEEGTLESSREYLDERYDQKVKNIGTSGLKAEKGAWASTAIAKKPWVGWFCDPANGLHVSKHADYTLCHQLSRDPLVEDKGAWSHHV